MYSVCAHAVNRVCCAVDSRPTRKSVGRSELVAGEHRDPLRCSAPLQGQVASATDVPREAKQNSIPYRAKSWPYRGSSRASSGLRVCLAFFCPAPMQDAVWQYRDR